MYIQSVERISLIKNKRNTFAYLYNLHLLRTPTFSSCIATPCETGGKGVRKSHREEYKVANRTLDPHMYMYNLSKFPSLKSQFVVHEF